MSDWMQIRVFLPPDADDSVGFQKAIVAMLVKGLNLKSYDETEWRNDLNIRMDIAPCEPPPD
jgi:hypothetical protein